jgi:hypothetical protein
MPALRRGHLTALSGSRANDRDPLSRLLYFVRPGRYAAQGVYALFPHRRFDLYGRRNWLAARRVYLPWHTLGSASCLARTGGFVRHGIPDARGRNRCRTLCIRLVTAGCSCRGCIGSRLLSRCLGGVLHRTAARWCRLWRHIADGNGGNVSWTKADAASRVPGTCYGVALRAHTHPAANCSSGSFRFSFILVAGNTLRRLPGDKCVALVISGTNDLELVPGNVSLTRVELKRVRSTWLRSVSNDGVHEPGGIGATAVPSSAPIRDAPGSAHVFQISVRHPPRSNPSRLARR